MTVRVLVVEDEPVAARAHGTFVDATPGFATVATAATVADAVRTLADTEVDLVLLDMHLPDGHGLDLLRRLRASGHPSHVIAVTAAREVAVVRRAAAYGVVGYLIKPFTSAMLRARLRAYGEFAATLADDAPLDQEAVDAAFAAMHAQPTTPLPKGLSPETLQEITSLMVASAAGLTAAEVGVQAGVARVTARRYLEHLVETGRLRRAHRSSGAGRPHVVYQPLSPV